MSKLIINSTKKPSAIFSEGAQTFGFREEDLRMQRGTTVLPEMSAQLADRHPTRTPFYHNYISAAAQTPDTLRHLALSALDWMQSNMRGAQSFDGVHIIATSDFASDRESLRIFKADGSEHAIEDLTEVLVVRGYETNLELIIHALGDNKPAFEQRVIFHDRAPMAFDTMTAANEKRFRTEVDKFISEMFESMINPLLIDTEVSIDEAVTTIKSKLDALTAFAGCNDTQTLEQVRSWLCAKITADLTIKFISHFKIKNLLLVGNPFFNSHALKGIHNVVIGSFSVAPFDAHIGAFFHELPYDVLRGGLTIEPRDLDALDPEGNDAGTAREILREVEGKGLHAIIQGNACMLECISAHDLVMLRREGNRINATHQFAAPQVRPWRLVTAGSQLGPLYNVIGSLEYGLLFGVDGERVLRLRDGDIANRVAMANDGGHLYALPLKNYAQGEANYMRYGEIKALRGATIVDNE